MKKIFSILMASALFLSITPTTNVHAANQTNEKIQTTLTGYFSNFLEVKDKLKEVDNDYIDPNSSLKQYNNLLSQVTIKLYKGLDQQIDSYKVNVKINSISKEGNFTKVDVDNNVKCKYKGVSFDTSFTENHLIYLKTDSNKLLVEKDIYEADTKASDVENRIENNITSSKSNSLKSNSSNNYENYMFDKLNIVKKQITTVSDEVLKEKNATNTLNTSKGIMKLSSSRYSGSAAANYALNNVHSSEDYPDNDCTNFVSKALHVGGIPYTETWYSGSLAWVNVVALRNWLTYSGCATEINNVSAFAFPGDVMQLYNYYKGAWSHSVIVTGKQGLVPYVSAHTYAKYNVPFTDYYPGNSSYSGYRALMIKY